MNKAILIGSIVVILGGAAFGVMRGKDKAGDVSTYGIEDMAPGTFKDFITGNMGTDMMCEFTHSVAESGTLTAKTYISGNKLSVYYEMTGIMGGPNGEQKNLHMISDGEYFYLWGDSLLGLAFQGMKYKLDLDENNETGVSDEAMEASMIDMDMPAINCKPWAVDEKFFEIPLDVEFMDLDNMMGDLTDSFSVGGEDIDLCETCDLLQGADKETCLEDMGCE